MSDHIKPSISESKEIHKFVQLYLLNSKRIPFLFLDDENTHNHGQIFLRGLKELKILNYPLSSEPHLRRNRYAALNSPEYEAVGMGRYKFQNGIFTAYSFSFDYSLNGRSLGPNLEHFEELCKLEPNFKFEIEPLNL